MNTKLSYENIQLKLEFETFKSEKKYLKFQENYIN